MVPDGLNDIQCTCFFRNHQQFATQALRRRQPNINWEISEHGSEFWCFHKCEWDRCRIEKPSDAHFKRSLVERLPPILVHLGTGRTGIVVWDRYA